MLLSTVSHNILNNFISSLLNIYCSQLIKSTNKEQLIKGLKSISHTSLEKNLSTEINAIVTEKFSVVIESLITCCKAFKTSFEICTNGTKPYIHSETKIPVNTEILELLKPMMEKDQMILMNAAFEVWVKLSEEITPTITTSENLVKLIGMIISLENSVSSIFKRLKYTAFIVYGSKSESEEKACRLAHFVYSLSCFIPVERFREDSNTF